MKSEEEYKYVTVMFPYPSGSGLHCGHWYNYALADSYCRYLRFIGNEVFQPFGYDAFGLPAENYARSIGGDPRTITYNNIENFRTQMTKMNTEFQELLITSDDNFQHYTKMIFTKLLEAGLAYKKDGVVDYCSSCVTVLAKEQSKNGVCERCGTKTEQKTMNQWYFKITEYKERLIKNLENIDYPESTKTQQRNWLNNLHDWCVSRQRSWGCKIPLDDETDTMDTFVDSSFYTIIYSIFSGRKPKPVDIYIGGSEHACLHLIYARFITMFLHDIGFVDFEEPFKKVIHQGMILSNGEKMSKSKGNVVNLDNFDSDEIRFYLMFIGHYFDGGDWSDEHIVGIQRFIKRMATWFAKNDGSDPINFENLKSRIFDNTEKFKFNKVVSEFMTFYNQNKNKQISREDKENILTLLEIYMPNIRTKIS